MSYDILIKNGHVIDTAAGVNGTKTIGLKGRKSAGYVENQAQGSIVIDASGCYVFPGLIDFHSHIYNKGSDLGLDPNILLSMGVTTAIDAGSCGSANFESFKLNIIDRSSVRIFADLNLCAYGQPGGGYHEDYDPDKFVAKTVIDLFERYPNELKGLKLRMSKEILNGRGTEPLYRAKDLTKHLRCPVVIHASGLPFPEPELASMLDAHDVICHCYHKKNEYTILDRNGYIYPEILDARERGVIFDASVGMTNYNHEVARQAIAQGFLPDIISTDLTRTTANRDGYCKNLPYVMSKLHCCGMELEDVVRAVTENPARELGLEGKIGTLQLGAFADVTICKLIDDKPVFMDNFQKALIGEHLLVPVMTIKDGEVKYRQTNF